MTEALTKLSCTFANILNPLTCLTHDSGAPAFEHKILDDTEDWLLKPAGANKLKATAINCYCREDDKVILRLSGRCVWIILGQRRIKCEEVTFIQPRLKITLSTVKFTPFIDCRWRRGLHIPAFAHLFVFVFVFFCDRNSLKSDISNRR